MLENINIGKLNCLCCRKENTNRIAYILYPMDILSDWIEPASEKYDVSIVIITGMDWESVFSPWAAKGVPSGSPDFKGEAPDFLRHLQQAIVPEIESALGLESDIERTLVGVSMSGLFALWQWIICDTFRNIASLSGSFWYEGFVDWMKQRAIPDKKGKAFFLLGDKESQSKIKAFDSVGQNTQEIITILKSKGIRTEFESVPGNHYSHPIPRLDKAFASLYTDLQ